MFDDYVLSQLAQAKITAVIGISRFYSTQQN